MKMLVLNVVLYLVFGAVVNAQWSRWKPLVQPRILSSLITPQALYNHVLQLQLIANATEGKNRVMGSKGHDDTVSYIVSQLKDPKLGGYYNVTMQPWTGLQQLNASGSLVINGINQTSFGVGLYSKPGSYSAEIKLVKDLGCSPGDYADTSGQIALIARGNCTFIEKITKAAQAGAVAVVIFNNLPGNFSITVSANVAERNGTIPTGTLNLTQGSALASALKNGTRINADIAINSVVREITTYNVLAETVGADEDNVIVFGAHSDSVAAGPGINDDGSGIASLVETARQLARYRVRNMIRFAWWSGEEAGLLGSTYYVSKLSTEARKQIKMYLNFDMMASPNFIYGIFDGDNEFNVTSPKGSGDITSLFEDFFASHDLPWVRVPFNGRSDYAPFMNVGIVSGGLKTGSDANKTVAEAEEFGGVAGIPYDKNYHQKGDDLSNLNMTAFYWNTRAIAHAVGTYGRSLSSVQFNETVYEGVGGQRAKGLDQPRPKGPAPTTSGGKDAKGVSGQLPKGLPWQRQGGGRPAWGWGREQEDDESGSDDEEGDEDWNKRKRVVKKSTSFKKRWRVPRSSTAMPDTAAYKRR